MPPRKCSREDCPSQHVNIEITVKCHRCNCSIHLPCYGVDKTCAEIFLTPNIVMLCDNCLEEGFAEPSPKRKPVMVQRTMDANLTLASPTTELLHVKTPKSAVNKTIESLSMEIKSQTATIAALKSSVDSMHGTLKQHTETDQTLVEKSNGQMSSIKESISETKNLIESMKQQTYANVLKRQLSQSETPKSSRTPKRSGLKQTPVMSGTSTKTIGKPRSPIQPRQREPRKERKVAEKAIWISKLHRDTTEDELLSYIRSDLGITDDKLEIRKLVRKDRDISTYSFVSFCIMCSANQFENLMDVNKWPTYSQIREFELNSNPSTGVKLNARGSTKNLQETPIETQNLPKPVEMETSQVN